MSSDMIEDTNKTHIGEKTTDSIEVRDENNKLKRDLKRRHMAMVAVGGTMGTGLFMGSGITISEGGPGGALLGYAITGVVSFFILTSLAEMSAFIPISGSFNAFADRFVDPAYGFAMSWFYFYNWVITVAADLVAFGIIINFWLPNANPIYFGLGVLAIICITNIIGVREYAEVEFCLSLVKIFSVITFLIIGTCIAAGWIGGHTYGVENWSYGSGAFKDGMLGIINVCVYAGYAYQGTEIIGVTSGESKNPSRDVPRAIRSSFWKVIFFYITSIFILGLLVKYDDPNLVTNEENAVPKSPFIVVYQAAKLTPAVHIMNTVVLISALSACNSGLYLSTRTLYALGLSKKAPTILARVSRRGTPIFSILICVVAALCIYLISLVGAHKVYSILLNISGVSGFFSWFGLLVSLWRFRRAYQIQGYKMCDLPYRCSLYPFGPCFALLFLVLIVGAQGHTAFTNAGGFDFKLFALYYFQIPLFATIYFLYKFIKKTKIIPLETMDLETDNYIEQGFENYSGEKMSLLAQVASFVL